MLQQFFTAVGFGLCHQMPSRSFFGGGVQLPVCARDTGIYLGFVAALFVAIALHRGTRPRRFPSAWGWVFIVALIGVMAVDGVTSYAGLRTTTNLIRLATGVATGYAVAALLLPLLNGELWERSNDVRVLTPGWRLGAWLLTLPAVVAVVWFGGSMLGLAYPFVVTAAILFTFIAVNMVFAALLPAFDRKASSLKDLAVPALIGLVLTLVEFIGAGALRLLAEAWARTL